MITKELIDRINVLARKQRCEGLTGEEKEEQHQLRQQYLKGIRGQVEDALSNIKFVEDEPQPVAAVNNILPSQAAAGAANPTAMIPGISTAMEKITRDN